MNDQIISLQIVNSGAAFDEFHGDEVARILRELADNIEGGKQVRVLRDVNGNKCGEVLYGENYV